MLGTDTLMAQQVRRLLAVAVIFGFGSIAWSALAPLEGAISAGGTLVLENNVKKVQHPTGGVVGQIDVREGQRVAAGDVLLRLDETATRANLGVVMNDQWPLSPVAPVSSPNATAGPPSTSPPS